MRGPIFEISDPKTGTVIGRMHVEAINGLFHTTIHWHTDNMKQSEDMFNEIVRNGIAGCKVRLQP